MSMFACSMYTCSLGSPAALSSYLRCSPSLFLPAAKPAGQEALDFSSRSCSLPKSSQLVAIRAIINIKAIIVEVPDLDSDQCDQLWPGVTRCDQCDQITKSNNNHQDHHYWGPWCQQKLFWPPVTNVTRLQRAVIIIKAIIIEVLDVNRYYCDHLWPPVTRWQSFKCGTKILNHFTTAGPLYGFPQGPTISQKNHRSMYTAPKSVLATTFTPWWRYLRYILVPGVSHLVYVCTVHVQVPVGLFLSSSLC